ncbi:MAG TPA: S8 family serine peptidase [Solirubrobacteraceae bacterium]|nr:S8 family serine peptidase [Solirubrobacteraceae bacterium]
MQADRAADAWTKAELDMRIGPRIAVLVALAAPAGALAGASAANAAPLLPGVNPAEVAVRRDCGTPAAGYAHCDAEQLVYAASDDPVGPSASPSQPSLPSDSAPALASQADVSPASTPLGYGPSELQSAYALTALSAANGVTKTLAIVDAYDDPNAEADLAEYRSHYGLPACTTANSCFRKVNQTGGTTKYPTANAGWAVEISLDLDMASAICPHCKILLVEATSALVSNLVVAEETAARASGVVAISNSYGLEEGSAGSPNWTPEEASAFSHPGIAITASAGDNGYEVEFPAVLGTVTAVGGTSLTKSGSAWSQAAWSGTGAGCSVNVAKPAWQTALGAADGGCAMRTNNDVSAVADPQTGVAVYDTYKEPGWFVVGGTSAASPIVAAFYALMGQEAGLGGASWDYAHTNYFSNVIGGSDQSGCASYLCEGVAGYNGPTGLGTPNGTGEALRSEEKPPQASSGAPVASTPTPSAPASSIVTSPPSGSTELVPVLYGLTLTHNAFVSLHRPRPHVFQVSFAFALSLPARVLVTLQRQVRVHGHVRFKELPYSLTLNAGKGRSSAHLRAYRALAPGTYRLTLTPAHGVARSIFVHVI